MSRQQPQDNLVVSIADLEKEGTKALPREVAEYHNEGAMDLIT